MARERYTDNLLISQSGVTVPAPAGTTVTIRDSNTDAVVSLYTVESAGISALANPFTITGSEGLVDFYVDLGRYKGVYSGGWGSGSQTFNVVDASPVRPVDTGGTEGDTASAARTNLGAASSADLTAVDGRVTVLEGLGDVPSGGSSGQVLSKIDGTDYNTEWAAAAGGTVDTSGTPVALDFARFTDATTIEGRSYAEAISDLSLGTVVKYDATATFTAGYVATSYSADTMTTGTLTPDAADGNFQHYINGGAHTLAVPSGATTIVLDVTNNGSAGAITTSAYDVVDGDGLTTTDTEAFRLFISVGNAGSTLTVKAMQ